MYITLIRRSIQEIKKFQYGIVKIGGELFATSAFQYAVRMLLYTQQILYDFPRYSVVFIYKISNVQLFLNTAIIILLKAI